MHLYILSTSLYAVRMLLIYSVIYILNGCLIVPGIGLPTFYRDNNTVNLFTHRSALLYWQFSDLSLRQYWLTWPFQSLL